MPRHRSIRHPTAHEEKFQVPTLWLVFCHNQSCIFDAYESALTIEDLWLYLSMHEQPVPRHGKNSTQQKKERDRERERERETKKGKKRTSKNDRASIDQSTGRQRVMVSSSHCFVAESSHESISTTRKTSRAQRTVQTPPCDIDCEGHSMSPSPTARWLFAQFTSNITAP